MISDDIRQTAAPQRDWSHHSSSKLSGLGSRVPGFQASRGNGYIILVGWDDFQKCMDGLFYSDYGWDDFRFFFEKLTKMCLQSNV